MLVNDNPFYHHLHNSTVIIYFHFIWSTYKRLHKTICIQYTLLYTPSVQKSITVSPLDHYYMSALTSIHNLSTSIIVHQSSLVFFPITRQSYPCFFHPLIFCSFPSPPPHLRLQSTLNTYSIQGTPIPYTGVTMESTLQVSTDSSTAVIPNVRCTPYKWGLGKLWLGMM